MEPFREAYLDIETTGLSAEQCRITVVGIYITKGSEESFIQMVGDQVNGDSILEAVQGVSKLYTYNGHRFDLPFINVRHGVNLENICSHTDLMYHCWRNNLYGGLKKVEQSLGIERKLKEVDGLAAVRLWWRYINDYDQEALKTLLEYNKEDVLNLKVLKERIITNDQC